jgi:hypothetical protein
MGFFEGATLEQSDDLMVGIPQNGMGFSVLEPLDCFIGEWGVNRCVSTVHDGIKGLSHKEMLNGRKGWKVSMDI